MTGAALTDFSADVVAKAEAIISDTLPEVGEEFRVIADGVASWPEPVYRDVAAYIRRRGAAIDRAAKAARAA